MSIYDYDPDQKPKTSKEERDKMMKKFLDFFVSPESKYKFFINDFSYPDDGRTGLFTVKIPLSVFYK